MAPGEARSRDSVWGGPYRLPPPLVQPKNLRRLRGQKTVRPGEPTRLLRVHHAEQPALDVTLGVGGDPASSPRAIVRGEPRRRSVRRQVEVGRHAFVKPLSDTLRPGCEPFSSVGIGLAGGENLQVAGYPFEELPPVEDFPVQLPLAFHRDSFCAGPLLKQGARDGRLLRHRKIEAVLREPRSLLRRHLDDHDAAQVVERAVAAALDDDPGVVEDGGAFPRGAWTPGDADPHLSRKLPEARPADRAMEEPTFPRIPLADPLSSVQRSDLCHAPVGTLWSAPGRFKGPS